MSAPTTETVTATPDAVLPTTPTIGDISRSLPEGVTASSSPTAATPHSRRHHIGNCSQQPRPHRRPCARRHRLATAHTESRLPTTVQSMRRSPGRRSTRPPIPHTGPTPDSSRDAASSLTTPGPSWLLRRLARRLPSNGLSAHLVSRAARETLGQPLTDRRPSPVAAANGSAHSEPVHRSVQPATFV